MPFQFEMTTVPCFSTIEGRLRRMLGVSEFRRNATYVYVLRFLLVFSVALDLQIDLPRCDVYDFHHWRTFYCYTDVDAMHYTHFAQSGLQSALNAAVRTEAHVADCGE